jgi:hypothetical protein
VKADGSIMLKEQIEVDAVLMVVPHLRNSQVSGEVDFSKARHATAADLENLGYRHHDRARQRAIEMFHLMHLEYDSDDDRICVLRYFVEMITFYDHDPDDESLVNLHNLIIGKGRVEAT